MKRLFSILALLAAFLTYGAGGSALFQAQPNPEKQTAASGIQSTKSEQVDALLASFSQKKIPGVAVLVIKEGKIVHHKGYGLARLDPEKPMGPDTAFDLASMSKPFTAMAVMILSERGKLSYDDPVSKFFPDFPPYAQKVSVRNLLTHTSGLVDVINPKWFKQGYEPTSNDLARLYKEEPNLKHTPGEKFEYNNGGYLLLALIVERVSGQTFPQFVRENIFKPLGMGHTVIWSEAKPKVEDFARSYAPGDNSFSSMNSVSDVFLYGPKGVISSTADLFKWNEALQTEKLVKASTLRQAFTPMKLNDGTTSSYGFGWFIGKDRGLELIEHAGGYLGYRTDIVLYPSERTTIVVLSNNAQVEAAPLARRIAHIYLADKMVAPTSKTLDAGILKTYVGKYKSDATAMPDLLLEITLEEAELYVTSAIRPKTRLLAKSATEFAIGESTATVTFNKDDKGGVAGLTLKTRMGIINAPRITP